MYSDCFSYSLLDYSLKQMFPTLAEAQAAWESVREDTWRCYEEETRSRIDANPYAPAGARAYDGIVDLGPENGRNGTPEEVRQSVAEFRERRPTVARSIDRYLELYLHHIAWWEDTHSKR